MLCIDAQGDAYLSINQGDGTATTPPTFKRVSDTALIMNNQGSPQANIRIADVDGDGRGDYVVVEDTGDIHVWRNGGTGDAPAYWQDMGIRWSNDFMNDWTGFRFADLNGGNGDDLLWMDHNGETYTWTNARSCMKGQDTGNGLNVAWRQGFHAGASSGPTHYGLESYYEAHNNGSQRTAIKFAKVYGTVAAFGERPLSDYLYFDHTEITATSHRYDVRVWKNLGTGGAKLKIDGDKYCNMQGNGDGSNDYVWTWSTGSMMLYPNAGLKTLTGTQEFWGPVVDNFWAPQGYVGRDLDRRDLHLADWDGDGLCDIVWTDPDNDNHVSVWINGHAAKGEWDWTYIADPASQLTCAQARGKAVRDVPVHLADITGNGRADYLCVAPDGLVTGYTQGDDGSWTDVGQIKFAEGLDRANLEWADVNGDGSADMIWTDKFTGDGSVWYNLGQVAESQRAANSGSAFSWDASGPAYAGSFAGTCQYYPDLDGNKRADLHSITDVFTNQAESWFNPSCGLTDNMDSSVPAVDPGLPQAPAGAVIGYGAGGGGGGGTGTGTGGNPPGQQCIAGHGPGDWNDLCQFTCQYDDCPSPCVCDARGTAPKAPAGTNPVGYPVHDYGMSEICCVACSEGFCPNECSTSSPGSLPPIPYNGGVVPMGYNETGCCNQLLVPWRGCNQITFPTAAKSFDPYEIQQDCSDPANAIYPWQCACDDCSAATNVDFSAADRWNSVFAQRCVEDLSEWYAGVLNGAASSSQPFDVDQHMASSIATRWGGYEAVHCNYLAPPEFYCDVIADSGW